MRVVPNLRECHVLKRLKITLTNRIATYHELEVYLSRVFSCIISPSFSSFIVRLSGPGSYNPEEVRSTDTVLYDLMMRDAKRGMVFRVEAVDPLDRLPPTSTQHLFRLEKCLWDAE